MTSCTNFRGKKRRRKVGSKYFILSVPVPKLVWLTSFTFAHGGRNLCVNPLEFCKNESAGIEVPTIIPILCTLTPVPIKGTSIPVPILNTSTPVPILCNLTPVPKLCTLTPVPKLWTLTSSQVVHLDPSSTVVHLDPSSTVVHLDPSSNIVHLIILVTQLYLQRITIIV